MPLEFDVYNPEKVFQTDPIGNDKSRALDLLDMESRDRRSVLRWITANHRPYPLPPNHPLNLFFETDEKHRQAGHIVLSEMIQTMPFFGAVVSLDRVKNIWHRHDDGEIHAGALNRAGYRFLLVQDYHDPFEFPHAQDSWDVFVADQAATNGKDQQEDLRIDLNNPLAIRTMQLLSQFHREYPDFQDFLPEKLPADVDAYEAAQFAAFNRMIIEAGSFFDFLDINSDTKNPEHFLNPDEVRHVKKMFYTMETGNIANPARVWYSMCGPFSRFEKTIYESYDYYGHLDELADAHEPMIDEETCYKLKLMNFWYTIPRSVEALTAKWLDKYVGLMAGIQGPFDWKGHGFDKPPADMVDHLIGSMESVLYYYGDLRRRLNGYPLAQQELDIKTAGLLNTFYDAGYTSLYNGIPTLFPELDIKVGLGNYNIYSSQADRVDASVQCEIHPQEFDYKKSRLTKKAA